MKTAPEFLASESPRSDIRPLLGYCSNVHPAERLDELIHQWNSVTVPVRDRLEMPGAQFAVGAWFPKPCVEELLEPGQVERLLEFCGSKGLRVGGINGFPQERFHTDSVKYQVYAPDWTTQARQDYTLNLARIAARLAVAQNSKEMGITTLPLGWWDKQRPARSTLSIKDHFLLSQATRRLAEVAWELERLSQNFGVDLHLDLEPEPGCAIENTAECIDYFENHCLREGATVLIKWQGLDQTHAESILRNRLRVCVDVCHVALTFEEPHATFEAYQTAGFRMGRIQLSSAMEVDFGPDAPGNRDLPFAQMPQSRLLEQLELYAHSPYLHQVSTRFADGSSAFFSDLPQAVQHWQETSRTGTHRIHCHVPVHLRALPMPTWLSHPAPNASAVAIRTTQPQLLNALQSPLAPRESCFWEVETYTWNHLPVHLRSNELTDGLAAELAWVYEQIRRRPGK